MKRHFQATRVAAALSAFVGAAATYAAKPSSDIAPGDVRRAVVAKAELLAAPASAKPLPSEWPQPFSPPGFERPAGAEGRDNVNAPFSGDAKAAALPPTDREALAAVAAKIPTSGTFIIGGKPLLISGTNKIEIGSRFTVVFNGQEYELELIAITSTTFTVRYKGEEYTRPILIKQGK